jgi:hypothetical protein
MSQRVRRLTRFGLVTLLIALIPLAGFVLYLRWQANRPLPPNNNQLLIGAAATTNRVAVAIVPPAEFDGLTRAAVYARRTDAIWREPQLVAAGYTPWDGTFGQILDGKPWWGMPGQWYYGSGARSIEGVSEESRMILNPYLLLSAEFLGFSHFYTDSYGSIWDHSKITEAALFSPDFPLTCEAEGLVWLPSDRRAEVTYDVTACLAALNAYTVAPFTLEDAWFGLYGYNARDLNLNAFLITLNEAQNITKYEPAATDPLLLPHFIHLGNSCGYVGGCNNASPAFAPLDDLRLTALPARLDVQLWHALPPSRDVAPDFVFTMYFE